MIKVKVKSVLGMAKILGASEIYVDLPHGSTVSDLIGALSEKYGSGFNEAVSFEKFCEVNRIEWRVSFLLNGSRISPSEMDERICADGDTLCLLTPLAGG